MEELLDIEYQKAIAIALKNGEISESDVDSDFLEMVKPYLNDELSIDDIIY